MSRTKVIAATAVAVLYIVLAAGFVREDRKTHTGGFINLQGMLSGLVTLPVAFPLEYWGHKINFRSNWQMAGAILVCAALIFGVIYGAISFVTFATASEN